MLPLPPLPSQVLSLQHGGSKDSSQSQFASYWKPILSMDANFWQRWLHMHRPRPAPPPPQTGGGVLEST